MSRTIFMVHGMWCRGKHLDTLAGHFETLGYRCFAPTLPFHEASGRAQAGVIGEVGIGVYLEFLEKALASLDLREPPVLLGHSLGGLLAQLLAARVRPGALVLLTPVAPRGMSPYSLSGIWTVAPLVLRWGFWKRPHRLGPRGFRYGIYNALPRAEQDALYPTFVHESGRVLFECMLPMLDRKKSTRVNPRNIDCPVFVAGAGKDRVTPPWLSRRIAERYRSHRYREYPGTSHWMITEPAIAKIARDIDAWLRSIPS